jgi:cell division protein FtsQ
MAAISKSNIETRKNRWRRRIINGLGEFLGAIGILFSIAALGLLFIYVYGCLLSTPYFEVKETSVRGLKELTEKDILTVAGIKPQQNMLAVNTEAVAYRVAANPWVKNIYVGRELPNKLVLEVVERSPVALYKQANDFYLMDSEGFVFKKLSRGDDVDLPILTCINSEEKISSKLLLSSLELLKNISASNQYAYLGTISEVHVDEVFGLSLLMEGGLYLRLGMNDFENKLKQLNVVMADMDKRGIKNGYISIDLCDVTKVTVQHKDALGHTEPVRKGKKYKT